MISHNSIIKCLFAAVLLTTPALYTQETEHLTQEQKEENLKKHFGVHLVTGVAPLVFSVASLITTQVAGQVIIKVLGIENSKVILAVRSLAFGTSTLASLYVMYKTPQWTDTYVLNKKKERTTKQNLLTLCHRCLLSWPIGVLTGEYFTLSGEQLRE